MERRTVAPIPKWFTISARRFHSIGSSCVAQDENIRAHAHRGSSSFRGTLISFRRVLALTLWMRVVFSFPSLVVPFFIMLCSRYDRNYEWFPGTQKSFNIIKNLIKKTLAEWWNWLNDVQCALRSGKSEQNAWERTNDRIRNSWYRRLETVPLRSCSRV